MLMPLPAGLLPLAQWQRQWRQRRRASNAPASASIAFSSIHRGGFQTRLYRFCVSVGMRRATAMAFNNRVAIVTGAARGIGEATARVLADKQATVAVVDIDVESADKAAQAICASGGQAKAFRCDVS